MTNAPVAGTDSFTPGLRDFSPGWLDRLAALWPNRVALLTPDGGGPYTYDHLARRARSVALGLKERGIGPGDRVACLMQNGVPMLDLLFACGHLGAIFVPLNWRLSAREVGGLMEDIGPHVVVAEPEFADLAHTTALNASLVTLDTNQATSYDQLLQTTGRLPQSIVCMDDPWLILYTGGTTGVPKGALLTHGSITWNAINTVVSWGLTGADIGPSFTPMFHTGGFNVFTLPLLLVGGRVILPERFNPADVPHLLEAEGVTVLFMVPTMFQRVAEQPGFAGADFSRLRWAISGGAPLPDPVYDRWRAKVRLFKQGYGLTEVGPNNFATPDADTIRKRGTVGRLTYFASARVVDDEGRDVPDGTAGELLLAGPHMCAGYWRRPEETDRAIRNGWFHTGDIARRDDEGYYWIVDRKKDMIITGGENVYPSEVETILYEHDAVREAVVVGMPDPDWGEAITAIVSLKPGRTATPSELRTHTRQNLAGYKVPKAVIIVADVPKSAAGKIVRAEAKKMLGNDLDGD